MVYLRTLCHLILIFAVFEPLKINYARGLIHTAHLKLKSDN
ncbi:hypothetical protein C789_4949 [Microcystis aeruginosa FACHB-905 = DIANCHI905]|uniref:Uncharacterized protein n=1 Tax=Microcystis aeruginosa PCC 7806SL TaxID=1903187 RepID=A0AB33BWG9_MICA7|nr:hypothetical protein BH695_5000 [Microcystis aeruginosa PCC 7806SL]ELS45237.1 hypothetical protein C789_4949 [Microcystis aeruginosa FACHB-905 = DIANCHI905]